MEHISEEQRNTLERLLKDGYPNAYWIDCYPMCNLFMITSVASYANGELMIDASDDEITIGIYPNGELFTPHKCSIDIEGVK